MDRSVCFDLASSTSIRASAHSRDRHPLCFCQQSTPTFLLQQNSTIIMSSSSSSDIQLFSGPPAPAPSSIVASGNSTPFIQQPLSLSTCLPSNIQGLLITIKHLLHTNHPPSPQDSVVISEVIRLIDDQVARLDTAMALPSTALPHISTRPFRMPWHQSASRDEQKTQRADVRRLRAQIQSLNSTVRRLPPEIWQEVFLFVRNHEAEVDVFSLLDPVYMVGQVCQLWRRVSQSCPRLWSRFLVSSTKLLKLSWCVSRLRMVLERTGSVPLDFTFSYRRGGRYSDTREAPVELLTLLMQYSSQWRSAEFRAITFAEALLLENVRGQVPEIRSVRLSLIREEFEPEQTNMISAFEIAPKLSQVVLGTLPLGHVLLDSGVKQQLQYLRLEHHERSDPMYSHGTPSLSAILHDYPNLTTVHISFEARESRVLARPTPPPPSATRSVYLKLTTLAVSEVEYLNHISLPNLVDLHAGLHAREYIPGLLPCIIGLIQHSRCSLLSLRLHYPEWDAASLGALLELVPDLEELSILFGGRGIDDMLHILMQYLGEQDGGGGRLRYVPRLKTLFIRLFQRNRPLPRWTFIDPAFLDMVSMRGARRGGLEVVRLRGNCDVMGMFPNPAFDWEQWEYMHDSGLLDVSQL
ncbi:hypothetical protein BDZ89DRAFT_474811 [Hymenopellis radicata]|nr:hypothetical protein BDZ89DRAFT_474811 [Hymenopellis radicata]